MNIHIFNLSRNITVDSLEILFGAHGRVVSTSLIPQQGSDNQNAFITMGSEAEAQSAVKRLNGSIIDGRIVGAHIIADC